MKKKWFVLVFGLIVSFKILGQNYFPESRNIGFVGLSDFDTMTYNFFDRMYDSVIKNNIRRCIRFKFSEALLFRLKHGDMNPHHDHIYSPKTKDVLTFATEVVLDVSESFGSIVTGNDRVIYETDFIFFNSIYPNLFDKAFIEGVQQWRYDNSKFINLSREDSIKVYNNLNNLVTDKWDYFVIKNAIGRVTNNNIEADKIRFESLNEFREFPIYNFYNGYDFLHGKLSNQEIFIVLNVPYSPAYFDGYDFERRKKNRYYSKYSSSVIRDVTGKTIGVYDLHKFIKIIPKNETYMYEF